MANRRIGSFAWLNVTQFLGALNDNVFKLLVILLLLHLIGDEQRTAIIGTVSIVFVIPFLLFSNASGVLADRISKQKILVFTKFMEVATMCLGCLGVYLQEPILLYIVIFLMCTQSSIFGPSKYGIIPELVDEHSLSKANSYLVGCSNLAIVIGTFLPSFALAFANVSHLGLGLCCVGIAIVGLLSSLGIETTKPGGSNKRPSLLFPREIYRTLRSIRHDRYLILTVFASAYFLFLGAFIQQNILLFGHDALKLTWEQSGYFFPMAAIGIGIGALIAGKLSGRNIEFGIVPIGAAGLSIVCVVMGLIPPGKVSFGVLLFFLGLFCGMFVVPLHAFVQYQAPKETRGEILAAQSFLSFIGVALSAGLIMLLNGKLGVSASGCFVVVGVLTGVLAIGTVRILPDFLVRFAVVVIAKCCYRIRVKGLENIPTRGPALIVSNHVTWADAVLMSATTQRRIRFVMNRHIMEGNFLSPIFRLIGAIPISTDDSPRAIAKSLLAARAALDEGALVCIFAEGAITRNGNMRGFRPGLEFILKKTDYPIIPAYIGGAWGSIFSYFHGKLLAAMPRAFPYPLSITFGAPMPSDANSYQVRQKITELSGEHFDGQKKPSRTLVHRFVRTARKRWRHPAIADTTGKKLTFGKTLISAIALSRRIDALVGDEENVGVVLPSLVGGALTNLAITLTGRVPVNLNFTASKDSVQYALDQCQIKTTISSRGFLEKLDGFVAPPNTVYLEDLVPSITTGDKLVGLFKALLAPARAMMTHRKAQPDDLATIIFSSGSTGRPKGVMLTHHNIISNIESFSLIFAFRNSDRVCGILPLFHSFGFTATLWAPLTVGFYAHYHPNPIDAPGIAKLIREEQLTILMTTPTFLLAYIRRAEPDDFKSLRTVVTGAEKLKPRVSDAFEKRFNVRPREGYGTTELSPVVGVSIPDADIDGIQQVGTKESSIGHPIPGIAIKITDPATDEVLELNAEGLVHVKGPNVMRGYLNEPEKTAEALVDGWYNTGDIGRIDEDGFLFLVDRLSRFSKIGGEMVPHLAIEEKLMEGLGAVNQVVAVAAAPDERKGEQLVVLYTDEAGETEKLQQIIEDCDIPNLWKPKKNNYFKVDAMPMLGSGKFDIKAIKDTARTCVEERNGGA
jgi:acyl-[acyl-carrier-protein]-phospholipid O-acyltransferase/long-chain-fatty-acid--[acyl-carrier-protein] ligase